MSRVFFTVFALTHPLALLRITGHGDSLSPEASPPMPTLARRRPLMRPLLSLLLLAVASIALPGSLLAAPGADGSLEKARQMRDSGDLQAAADAYGAYLQGHEKDAGARFELAQVLVGLGDLDQAEKQLQAAILLNRDTPGVWARLAQIYLLKGDMEHAEMSLVEARNRDPKEPSVRYNLGRLFEQEGREEESNAEYTAFLEAAPDDPRAPGIRLRVARHLESTRQLDQALVQYQKLVETHPDKPGLRQMYADVLYQLLKYDEAYDQYQQILAQDPNNSAAHFNSGFILKSRGDLEGAEREMRLAEKIDPSTNTLFHLGSVLFENGDYEGAAVRFEKVIEAEPEHPQAHYYYARALQKLGKTDQARAEMEKHQEIVKQIRSKQTVPGTMETP